MDSLDQDEFNSPYDVSFQSYRFSTILNFKETRYFCLFSYNLCLTLPMSGTHHRQSNPHRSYPNIFDFQNRLSGTANQNRQQSNQTVNWIKSPHQTWYDDSEPSFEDVHTIWCNMITGCGCRKQKLVLGNYY